MSAIINIERLYTVNFFDLSPTFNTTVHNHEDWELLYVDSGEVNCITSDGRIFLKQGDVIFHQPRKTHSTVCNGKKSASIFNIHFVTDSPVMERLKNRTFSVPQKAADALKRLIDECNATYSVSEYPLSLRETAPIGGEQMSLLLLEEFLILLLRNAEGRETPHAATNNQGYRSNQIEEICDYLRSNIYGKVTLNDLVERFHFSKSFLCEQFKKNKGQSPVSYYLELKLTEAKRLLREDDITITEISEKLSFESPEYFSRYFKKRVGHSPRDFRNMLINDASLRKIK